LTDIYGRKKRSWIMSRVRSEGSKIERIIEAELRKASVNYTAHPAGVFGRPDFIIKDNKIAIFCDSDFWHGYRAGRKRLSQYPPFWREKIAKNKVRDIRVNRILSKEGWSILRFWGHQIQRHPDRCVSVILRAAEKAGDDRTQERHP
jgi:DNA mismatch endonuclease, patch repair protein